jgi:hypothetical protein
LQAHGITELTPWHIITADHARGLRIEFQKETATAFHSIRDILPFAARQENDDIVGYVVVDGVVTTQVIGTHPTWRGAPEVEGFPGVWRYESFWDWLKAVIDDTAEWCSEEELTDRLEE